jgi:hypothetical protein
MQDEQEARMNNLVAQNAELREEVLKYREEVVRLKSILLASGHNIL